MIPVLYKFTVDTLASQLVLALVALAVVAYAAWSGWRNAVGPMNPKTGEYAEPTRDERVQRTIKFGLIGFALALVGAYYAIPLPFQLPILGKGGEGIPVHTYGILLGGGFLSAVVAAGWIAQREWPGDEGLKKREQIFDMAFWAFVGGIGGSRIYFILVNWDEFMRNPSPFGGLVFYGGLIGAAVAIYLWSRKNGIDFMRLCDVCIPTVSLGQCLGRLGCFSAGCCWGDIAKPGFPLAVEFPGVGLVRTLFGGTSDTPSLAFQGQLEDKTRYIMESTGQVLDQAAPGAVKISQWVASHGHTLPVHPTQLYESIGQLCLFVLFVYLRRFKRFHGQIFGMWLMAYAVLRTSVEYFRGDYARGTIHGLLASKVPSLAEKIPLDAWYNLSAGQLTSLCLFTLGAVIVYRKGRAMPERPSLDGPVAASPA
jgi:phosphatidylglycerol:prolipoprotein diacylglycerol transferase